MGDEVRWPPDMAKLPDWDNGGGIAVICGASEHRVVWRGDKIVAADHLQIGLEVNAARSAIAAGDVEVLGYRLYSPGFIEDDLLRWRGAPWTDSGVRGEQPNIGQVNDPDRLAPCVRLIVEGFVPCLWCGTLLRERNACTSTNDWTCALSNAGGWKRAIPLGWVQATLVGAPPGLTRAWPGEYRWKRNGPFTHHPQIFLSSPWFPEVHPRRLKNQICQFADTRGISLREAAADVIRQLSKELGPMRPPPPITNFKFRRR